MSLADSRALDAIRNVTVPSNGLEAATVHLTVAVRAASMKAHDALEIAVAALKNMNVATVAKAALEWIKTHPWETAAIVVSLVLMACTPVFLGMAGFTAGGIAAGSLAAGIQAGIGNVAAGSVFATLTSAGMAGYGVPIVVGGVWGIGSAVGWGLVWNHWREGYVKNGNDGNGDKHSACGGTLLIKEE